MDYNMGNDKRHPKNEERHSPQIKPRLKNLRKPPLRDLSSTENKPASMEKKPASVEKDLVEERPSKSSSESKKPRDSEHSNLPPVVELAKKNREFYEERKWPDGVVRYVLKNNKENEFDLEDARRRLQEAYEILKKKTCARMEELTEAESDNYEDFLVLDDSPDYITGRVGGRQSFGVIELLKGGQHRQHAAMVVMAMLGFYFEVSRHDRDQHIRVHTRHVRPDKLHHFEKIREDATFPLPYDYKSATHPAWQFWRHLGKTGISTVATFKTTDPDGILMKSLGQNSQLFSDSDIIKINTIYGVECFMKTKEKASGEEQGNEEQGREEQGREKQGREEQGREEQGREEQGREEQGREEQGREEQGREEQGREEQGREEQGREEQGREERGNEERGREERSGEKRGRAGKGLGRKGTHERF